MNIGRTVNLPCNGLVVGTTDTSTHFNKCSIGLRSFLSAADIPALDPLTEPWPWLEEDDCNRFSPNITSLLLLFTDTSGFFVAGRVRSMNGFTWVASLTTSSLAMLRYGTLMVTVGWAGATGPANPSASIGSLAASSECVRKKTCQIQAWNGSCTQVLRLPNTEMDMMIMLINVVSVSKAQTY